MEFFTPRKLIFKAWNKEAQLLMRLNSIDCKKGELFKKDHILLQFTGLYDKQQDEIFEMDIMMVKSEKFLVLWDEQRSGWNLVQLNNKSIAEPFVKENASKARRLWNFFEAEKRG
jgi:hypothetical protein